MTEAVLVELAKLLILAGVALFVWMALVGAAAVVLVRLLGVLVRRGYDDLRPVRWADDHPELTTQFEDACNERFGYDWEFEPTEEVVTQFENNQTEYTIVCFKGTGFASGTSERITVEAIADAE